MMSVGKAILSDLRQQQNLTDYRKKHWEGLSEMGGETGRAPGCGV